MTRKNYFELLKENEMDPHNEYKKIVQLLEHKVVMCFPKMKLSPNGTPVVDDFVDVDGSTHEDFFTDEWTLMNMIHNDFFGYEKRRTTTSFTQLLDELEINHCNDFDTLYTFFECLLDVFEGLNLDIRVRNYEGFIDLISEIRKNINIILDESNHELITLENGDKIIVEKNVYASEVSQIISETNIEDAIKVLEYNHFLNKGNIQRKKEILLSLAGYLEPYLKEFERPKKLSDESKVIYTELKEVLRLNKDKSKIIAFDRLSEMYNKGGLRHNNDKQYHLNMNDEELEQWYDNIYSSTLFVILSMEMGKNLSKLNELKKK
ncbi:acyl-CoA synthetase family protein [Streptococcus sanguinis]|uniref:hypothetical protein n=1 Tax=Streptococcus sanguinis TaxID=1305 RepID=UPI001D14000C|nr:hypothetical protein [Streptococcus sanguinis]MCC3171916.1 hypothetical protein [Streptococcus sanguinis]